MLRVLYFAVIFGGLFFESHCNLYIENFQKHSDVTLWSEHSDTLKPEGMSKASLVLQSTGQFRRAILFTMLNPQTCGAGFAGVRKNVTLDIIYKYRAIAMKIRGQGQFRGYEFFLRDRIETKNDIPTYVHYFQAPSEFEVIYLPLQNFKPYLRGIRIEEDYNPMDITYVRSLGILAYGGAHKTIKQYGVAALEIDWIRLE